MQSRSYTVQEEYTLKETKNIYLPVDHSDVWPLWKIEQDHILSVFFTPLQGALYCLLGNHSGICLANLQYWDCIALTWPAIVRSGMSPSMSLEKSSVVRLFDDLADKIHRQYETIGIDFTVSSANSSLNEGETPIKHQKKVHTSALSNLKAFVHNLKY